MRLGLFLFGPWGQAVVWCRVLGPPGVHDDFWDEEHSRFVFSPWPPAQIEWDFGQPPDFHWIELDEVLWNEGLEVLVPAVGAALIAILVAGLPAPPPQ